MPKYQNHKLVIWGAAMKICVVGTGYVGLVTGACFADMGHSVLCVDKDETKISSLRSGEVPFFEPDLLDFLFRNVAAERLHFTTALETGIENAQVCFIAVGTPSGKDGAADLSQVMEVAADIGKYMGQSLIIANKSTVPVGTAVKVREIIAQKLCARGERKLDYCVVSNPEFLREGSAIHDFLYPDRVIVGTNDSKAVKVMKELYMSVTNKERPLLIMDITSAEITKYAANAMLATRISFMNELAVLCDNVGGNVEQVRTGIGLDRRIGRHFLRAGIGYGGSCFPKDLRELINTGRKNGIDLQIAYAVNYVNEKQKRYLFDKIQQRFGERLRGMRFGVWGLSFKPLTDDMREAPSKIIIQLLFEQGAEVVAYDPKALAQAKQMMANYAAQVCYVDDMMEAVNDADALLLLTEWPQFKNPDYNELKSRMKSAIIFDGRNCLEPDTVVSYGFEYHCIGRNSYG